MEQSDIKLHRCGVKFHPPAIVVTYRLDGVSSKLHRRTMPLRDFTVNSSVAKTAEDLKSSEHHRQYLKQMSVTQLERLVTIIRDKLSGMSVEACIAKNRTDDAIDIINDRTKTNMVVTNTAVAKSSNNVINMPPSTSVLNSENTSLTMIDPNEDLNWLDDEALQKKKELMDVTFKQNHVTPDNPDFQYDIQVDFDTGAMESCAWDNSEASDF